MGKLVTNECISSFITNHYGKTDISTIGDGTVTGAISSLNSNLNNILHIKRVTRDNLTIAKGADDYFNFEAPIENGYARSIISVSAGNATTNGYGASYFLYNGYATPDSAYVKLYCRNLNTTRDIKLQLWIDVLYVKSAFVNW